MASEDGGSTARLAVLIDGLPGSGPAARAGGAGRCGFMANGAPQPASREFRAYQHRVKTSRTGESVSTYSAGTH
jgi:hypothetical protein